MITRSECLCDGKILGIETIYTVIDGNQINIKEKLDWVREKGRKNELFCPCGCGLNFIVVAGENNLREQHFRIKAGSVAKTKCHYVDEGPVSINSKIILKCWLDEKIRPADLESRVPICDVEDSKRKYEFTLLSRERKIAVNYCYNRANLSAEKMQILDQNSEGIHIIHVIDNQNSGTVLQYPEGAMKVQERQGYCLFLDVPGFEYQKARLMAAYYAKDIDGYWREETFAEGKLTDFYIGETGEVFLNTQRLSTLRDACKQRFEEVQSAEKQRRIKAEEERERERIRLQKEREAEEKRREEERQARQKAQEELLKKQREEQERWEREQAEREEERKRRIAQQKEAEEKEAALDHPKRMAVYSILSGCSFLQGRFAYKVTDGVKYRNVMADISDVTIDLRNGRIVLTKSDKSKIYIFVQENGAGPGIERSGAYYLNIDLNDTPLERIPEKLGEYFIFQ